jgi:hypothetical protein
MINMTPEEIEYELEQIELQKQYEQMSYDADAQYYGEQ